MESMMELHSKNGIGVSLTVDFQSGSVVSMQYGGCELVAKKTPLFRLRLMDGDGNFYITDAFAATRCSCNGTEAVYAGFPYDIKVTVRANGGRFADWSITINNNTDMLIEWVDFPVVTLKPLVKNGGDASVLLPYNEGVIVEDAQLRQESFYTDAEPEYPSLGTYSIFPNMMCSQFMCYMFDGHGLYFGAHDTGRAVKGIHVRPDGEGVALYFKLFCGGEFGADYKSDFPVVWDCFEGDWHDGADIYKAWFEKNLPQGVKKVVDNDSLPAWYEQSPLVITYPVRGVHDMDKMDPNALFPYNNALPLIDEISEKTGTQLMVLLMHWEGSAPWAPPYVWPPYGGEEAFNSFADNLHARGHLLGVYCSGFGYTIESNLVDDYSREAEFNQEGLHTAMCASPAGKAERSRICTVQRSGYDLCLGSDKAQQILDDAYTPLFESKVDYIQILDQNHGGGQYFCYSRSHNHPPAPGKWMTEEMCKLLQKWRIKGGKRLFGCESSTAEPFMGYLLFNDNRYEVNWHFGEPVGLFAYLYHEYLRNFMGNQVSCGLSPAVDTLRLRMAYSFALGDCMTLVVTPDGRLMTNWGNHDFSIMPDREKALHFAANMQRFYREQAKPYLYAGKMIKPKGYTCSCTEYSKENGLTTKIPDCISTAWESNGKQVQIFVNHTERDCEIVCMGNTVTVPALEAAMIELSYV